MTCTPLTCRLWPRTRLHRAIEEGRRRAVRVEVDDVELPVRLAAEVHEQHCVRLRGLDRRGREAVEAHVRGDRGAGGGVHVVDDDLGNAGDLSRVPKEAAPWSQ